MRRSWADSNQMEAGPEAEEGAHWCVCLTVCAEAPTVTAPFKNWKDPRGYHAILRVCAPCHAVGRSTALPNRGKALNHWAADGSGKQTSGTIKDCPCSHKIAGLQQFARAQNRLKAPAREEKISTARLQQQRDEAAKEAAIHAIDSTSTFTTQVSAGSLRKGATVGTPRLASRSLEFVGAWSAKLDRAIAQVVIEEATPLVFPQKPAVREAIDAAIEFGVNVGSGVYCHAGKKRMRNEVIPHVVTKQDGRLEGFDANLARFGATLVSDGKDDVAKDHLVNYVTVCPDGYRWEAATNVSGISRKAEWVAQDLIARVTSLDDELRAKLEGVQEYFI